MAGLFGSNPLDQYIFQGGAEGQKRGGFTQGLAQGQQLAKQTTDPLLKNEIQMLNLQNSLRQRERQEERQNLQFERSQRTEDRLLANTEEARRNRKQKEFLGNIESMGLRGASQEQALKYGSQLGIDPSTISTHYYRGNFDKEQLAENKAYKAQVTAQRDQLNTLKQQKLSQEQKVNFLNAAGRAVAGDMDQLVKRIFVTEEAKNAVIKTINPKWDPNNPKAPPANSFLTGKNFLQILEATKKQLSGPNAKQFRDQMNWEPYMALQGKVLHFDALKDEQSNLFGAAGFRTEKYIPFTRKQYSIGRVASVLNAIKGGAGNIVSPQKGENPLSRVRTITRNIAGFIKDKDVRKEIPNIDQYLRTINTYLTRVAKGSDQADTGFYRDVERLSDRFGEKAIDQIVTLLGNMNNLSSVENVESQRKKETPGAFDLRGFYSLK